MDAEEHGYVGMEAVVGEYLILLQYLLQVLLHVLHYLDGHLPPIGHLYGPETIVNVRNRFFLNLIYFW